MLLSVGFLQLFLAPLGKSVANSQKKPRKFFPRKSGGAPENLQPRQTAEPVAAAKPACRCPDHDRRPPSYHCRTGRNPAAHTSRITTGHISAAPALPACISTPGDKATNDHTARTKLTQLPCPSRLVPTGQRPLVLRCAGKIGRSTLRVPVQDLVGESGAIATPQPWPWLLPLDRADSAAPAMAPSLVTGGCHSDASATPPRRLRVLERHH